MKTDFWSTTLSGLRTGEDWGSLASYSRPVRRFLDVHRAYRWVPESDRDDIAQEVMVGLWAGGKDAYNAERGRFRGFLQGVIRNKVADYARRRRVAGVVEHDLDAVPVDKADEPDEESLADATQFSADLIRAVRGFHDAARNDPERGMARLYCLIGRLVGGLTQSAIAEREGLSRDQVKRHLEASRRDIIGRLVAIGLERELGDPGTDALRDRVTAVVRASIKDPRSLERRLEAEADPRVRLAAGWIGSNVIQQHAFFEVSALPDWNEFLRGLREVFELGSPRVVPD